MPTQEPMTDCAEPVRQLATVPGDALEEHLGATLREVLEIVWRGHNGYPERKARCVVEIVGNVVVEDAPRAFTLAVWQRDGVQHYDLDVDGYASLDLDVDAGPGQVARYRLDRSGAGEGAPVEGTIPLASD